ncbi:MAG: hypothetical protein GKS07_01975 [Nitrosopumilus sp.]|nr:MAG: hypothetical protein GKS07_01975 [Nitrosopumilus sp.]
MSNDKQLDKDRKAAYCSQCYDNIRLQCPACRLSKIPRHCKIYKNPASLWWHIKQEHDDFVYSEFSCDDVLVVLNNMTKAIKWGIIPNV